MMSSCSLCHSRSCVCEKEFEETLKKFRLQEENKNIAVYAEEKENETWISLALDLTPIVGTVKAAIQLTTGIDVVTGEKVERLGEFLGLIPIGKLLFKGSKIIELLKSGEPLTKQEYKRILSCISLKEGATDLDVKHFSRKLSYLKKAVEEGKLGTKLVYPEKEISKARNAYRKKVKDFIKRIPDEDKKKRLLEQLKKRDVDHKLDLQWGGTNDISNLSLLSSSVNRSIGKQIERRTKAALKEKFNKQTEAVKSEFNKYLTGNTSLQAAKQHLNGKKNEFLGERQDRIEKKRQEIMAKEKELEELKQTINKQEKEIEQTKKELEEAKAKLEKIKLQIEDIDKEIEIIKQKIKESEAELEKQNQTLEEKRELCNDLSEAKQVRTQQADQTKRQVEKCTRDISKEETVLKTFKDEETTLIQQENVLKLELEQLQKNIEIEQQHLERDKTELEQLKAQLAEAINKVESAESERNAIQERMRSLEMEIANVKKEIELKKKLLEELQAQAAANATNPMLQSAALIAITALKIEIAILETDLIGKDAESKNLLSLEAEARQKTELKNQKKELIKSKVEQKEAICTEIGRALELKNGELEIKQREHLKVAEDSKRKAKQIAASEVKINNKEIVLEALQNKLFDIDQEIKHLNSEIEEAKRITEETIKMINTLTEKQKLLIEEKTKKESEMQIYKKDIEDVQTKLEEKNKSLLSEKRRLQRIESELENLYSEHHILESIQDEAKESKTTSQVNHNYINREQINYSFS